MSNTIVTEERVAKSALKNLMNNCVMGSLVHRGYDSDIKAQKGDTIRILKPVEFESKSFTTTTTVQDITEDYVPLVVDHHEDVTFEYGSKEKAMTMPDFEARYIEPAMIAIAEKIDQDLCKLGLEIDTYYGTPGDTPDTKADILGARKNLQTQKVTLRNRKFVMDENAEAEYLDLFSDADKDGSTAALREASLGRRFGLDTYMDQNIYTHTPGALVAGASQNYAVNATIVAGVKTIVLKSTGGTLTGSVKKGDIVTFAGIAQTYTVKADATAATNLITLTFEQALPAINVNTVATIVGVVSATGAVTAYTNNLLFQKEALTIGFADLERPDGAAWSKVVTYKGWALRCVKAYNASTKKETLSIDVLYGVKASDPRKATRLIG